VASLKNCDSESNTQSSVKLVATNLIANGKLEEGIELLCMVGFVLDACRYLQDNNQWEKATWLAKLRLTNSDYIDVVNKWCDHLCAINRKVYLIFFLSKNL
jgi:WD repeat-containing protein 11